MSADAAFKLAALLNGREYGSEITEAEATQAKDDGLVVVFGYSDDGIEFRGAIDEEDGAYDRGEGSEHHIVDGKLYREPDCECQWAEAAKRAALDRAVLIRSRYSGDGWSFETSIPHATFDVMEDGTMFGRGIVFRLQDAR